jgi:hypothetical protein
VLVIAMVLLLLRVVVVVLLSVVVVLLSVVAAMGLVIAVVVVLILVVEVLLVVMEVVVVVEAVVGRVVVSKEHSVPLQLQCAAIAHSLSVPNRVTVWQMQSVTCPFVFGMGSVCISHTFPLISMAWHALLASHAALHSSTVPWNFCAIVPAEPSAALQQPIFSSKATQAVVFGVGVCTAAGVGNGKGVGVGAPGAPGQAPHTGKKALESRPMSQISYAVRPRSGSAQ